MGCFVILVIVVFAFLALSRVGVDVHRTTGSRSRRAFQHLTRRFGGEYRSLGFRRRPSVQFRYGAASVKVVDHSQSGRMATEVVIQWPDSSLQLELLTRRFLASPMGPFHLDEMRVGDDAFNDDYLVRGNNVEKVTRLLSEAVRCQIACLSMAFDQPALRVTLSAGQLSVEKPMPFFRSDDLEQFTQLAIELYDQCMLTQVEGIEFLGSDEAQPIEESICQVCGEQITDNMVFCQRCRTPHHRECWQYIGSCSTFGCQGTQFEVPVVAEEVEPPAEKEKE